MDDILTLQSWIVESIREADLPLLREVLAESPSLSRQAINHEAKRQPALVWQCGELIDRATFDLLVEFGLDVTKPAWSVACAPNSDLMKWLLEAGAPSHPLDGHSRRGLTGAQDDDRRPMFTCTPEHYLHNRIRVFGSGNPSRSSNPFWQDMLRSRVPAYSARSHFAALGAGSMPTLAWDEGGPRGMSSKAVWCAARMGQSVSVLDDGCVVEIGGEHEDYYDPDFCIYNDVFVHTPDGRTTVYSYPPTVFPPTDFHSATVVGRWIYIIGSMGYQQQREPGVEPVYVLDTRDFSIRRMATKGQGPGWIHGHAAQARSDSEIVVWGGKRLTATGQFEPLQDDERHVLNLADKRWKRC